MDLTVSGQPLHSGVAPLTVTGERSLALGDHEVAAMQGAATWSPPPCPSPTAWTTPWPWWRKRGTPALHVFTDTNTSALTADTGKVRVAHLALASPDLSVGTTAPLTQTLAALSYGEMGDCQVVATGASAAQHCAEAGTETNC